MVTIIITVVERQERRSLQHYKWIQALLRRDPTCTSKDRSKVRASIA